MGTGARKKQVRLSKSTEGRCVDINAITASNAGISIGFGLLGTGHRSGSCGAEHALEAERGRRCHIWSRQHLALAVG